MLVHPAIADHVGCETCRRRKVRCNRPESTIPRVDEGSTAVADVSASTPPGPEQKLPACLVGWADHEDIVSRLKYSHVWPSERTVSQCTAGDA